MVRFLIITVLLIVSTGVLFATKEEWFNNCLVPLVPVISVAFGLLGTANINHLFWKKREETMKRNRISEERINTYLKFCEYNLEFNACTDHIMRLSKKKETPSGTKEVQNNEQAIRNLEVKGIDALKGLIQQIGYARIFFKSEQVPKNIETYAYFYNLIRTGEIKWDEEGEAFGKLLKLSKKIETSLEDELKDEIKESQKRRWWQ